MQASRFRLTFFGAGSIVWPMTTAVRSQGVPAEWLAEFEAAARRPLPVRMRYAFIHTYKPVLDDAPFRSFESTQQYREWCEANLPAWLGYGGV
jgi:hypothetical protein